jgi:hypothetical protein
MFLLKALLVFVLMAMAETAHGILRVRFLNRKLGARKARQIGVLTGSLIVFSIVWLTLPWLRVQSLTHAAYLGVAWFVAMLAFDVFVGRCLFGVPWSRILQEFNPSEGGFLGFGMLVVLVSPIVIFQIRES